MICENNRHGRVTWTTLNGLLSKGLVWITLFLICCEFTCCVNGGELGLMLKITPKTGKEEIAKRCRYVLVSHSVEMVAVGARVL